MKRKHASTAATDSTVSTSSQAVMSSSDTSRERAHQPMSCPHRSPPPPSSRGRERGREGETEVRLGWRTECPLQRVEPGLDVGHRGAPADELLAIPPEEVR